jgi:hypothetical protein
MLQNFSADIGVAVIEFSRIMALEESSSLCQSCERLRGRVNSEQFARSAITSDATLTERFGVKFDPSLLGSANLDRALSMAPPE